MLYFSDISLSVIKIAVISASSFGIAFFLTPGLTHILYKYKLWRKTVRTQALGGGELPVFQKFHGDGEIHTPRFGGILIWIVPPLLALVYLILAQTGNAWLEKLSFLSRGQTWLPIATLLSASAVGFIDDIVQVITPPEKGILKTIWNKPGKHFAGGLSLKHRILLISSIAFVGAWWFFYKLEMSTIHIPGGADISLGLFYLPFFVIVMLATYAGGVIDGIDGLSGGAFMYIFGAFGIIAFAQGQIDLAALCFAVVGALLAFLWFNIPPARFYM